jgi:hypothetical protein
MTEPLPWPSLPSPCSPRRRPTPEASPKHTRPTLNPLHARQRRRKFTMTARVGAVLCLPPTLREAPVRRMLHYGPPGGQR